MAVNLPNPPPASSPSDFASPAWQNWFARLATKVRTAAQILWTQIDFTGSNLTSILTRNHNDLQNIQGGAAADYNHLTTAQVGIVNSVPTTYAPLASPALTGTPTAPTAAAGTNTTQLATTAFVMSRFDKASGYRAAALTFTASAVTTVVIDTVLFDTKSIITTANGRITPKQAGYYQISGSLAIAASGSGQFLTLLFLKNDAIAAIGAQIQTTTNGNAYAAGSALLYFNGTTDYLNLGGYTNGAWSLAVSGGATTNTISVVGPF